MPKDFRKNLVLITDTILETIRIIDRQGIPIGLVHDNGRLIGTVTDGDIRRGILAGVPLEASAAKVMNTRPVTAPEGISDAEALAIMRQHSILFLPVVADGGRLVGLKALKDLTPLTDAANPVVIMAGGLGTRLRPETETLPKPMLDVGGKPILENIIERLVGQGFCDITLAVNYKKEMIEDYFDSGEKWGARISYVHERTPLGTAGALSLLPSRPARPLIVMNGDIVTNIKFNNLVKYHDEQGAPATMSAAERHDPIRYGVLVIDGAELRDIEEKPVRRYFVNAGIYVINPDALELIPRDRAFDMPDLFKVLRQRAEQGLCPYPAVFPLREDWFDVGVRDDLEVVKRDFTSMFPQHE